MKPSYDVIIIGGSYSGLSAGMSLGRALRQVLIIDDGQPCNRQTPRSHNFITHDGEAPATIAARAKENVLQYKTVRFYNSRAVNARKTAGGFEIHTRSGDIFTSRKLLLATGLKDIMPGIPGFAECWGISILHCPYCHGYEVRDKKTGILARGDFAYHLAQLISNWTQELLLFTNGKAMLTAEQEEKIRENNITVIEKEIMHINHNQGQVRELIFKDGSAASLNALYARPDFIQNSDIPRELGCEHTGQGLIRVDAFQQTSVEGVHACGDNSGMRAVAVAVAAGTMAGAAINHKLTEEEFNTLG